MSTETLAPAADMHDAHSEGAHAHPSEKQYIVVALVLGLFTAIEVATYFFDFGNAAIPVLLSLMVIKFVLVVLYFMHLKFDSPVFIRLFGAGLTLAVGVYSIFLAAFQFGR